MLETAVSAATGTTFPDLWVHSSKLICSLGLNDPQCRKLVLAMASAAATSVGSEFKFWLKCVVFRIKSTIFETALPTLDLSLTTHTSPLHGVTCVNHAEYQHMALRRGDKKKRLAAKWNSRTRVNQVCQSPLRCPSIHCVNLYKFAGESWCT